MAQITKRTGKNGKVSYLIRVSDGYGVDGKQRKKSSTWTPPEGMTPKKTEKQAQVEAMRFEEAVSAGAVQDGAIRFQTFAERRSDFNVWPLLVSPCTPFLCVFLSQFQFLSLYHNVCTCVFLCIIIGFSGFP